MADRSARLGALRAPAIALVVVLALALGALAVDEFRTADDPDRTTVVVTDEDGTRLGAVEVRVADTFRERYVGLSDTTSLGPDEGMLFVHDSVGNYSYVMRDMAFPIDIVFVGPDGTITAIHHAEVEQRPLTPYSGRGRGVLEVPYHWTTDHGVTVGDRVTIEG